MKLVLLTIAPAVYLAQEHGGFAPPYPGAPPAAAVPYAPLAAAQPYAPLATQNPCLPNWPTPAAAATKYMEHSNRRDNSPCPPQLLECLKCLNILLPSPPGSPPQPNPLQPDAGTMALPIQPDFRCGAPIAPAPVAPPPPPPKPKQCRMLALSDNNPCIKVDIASEAPGQCLGQDFKGIVKDNVMNFNHNSYRLINIAGDNIPAGTCAEHQLPYKKQKMTACYCCRGDGVAPATNPICARAWE